MSASRKTAGNVLKNYLTSIDTLPEKPADAIYIMGGSTISTYRHQKKASKMYKNGLARHILIYQNVLKDEYDTIFKRNLNNNEWTIRHLINSGIPDSVIFIIPVKKRFFGTLSEGHDCSEYFKSKNYRSVILLSSPCHSRRVALSFRAYLASSEIRIYIQGSDDPFAFSELVYETIKVQIYRIIIGVFMR